MGGRAKYKSNQSKGTYYSAIAHEDCVTCRDEGMSEVSVSSS